jgi:hypothetical protein
VLREAIADTRRIALARVLIGQRERTIAVRAMAGGLVPIRSMSSAISMTADRSSATRPRSRFDPEMVQLARQLIDRQTTKYDPSDLEDRYETRLRAMIDAKLQGEAIDLSEPVEPDRRNVIDSLGGTENKPGAGRGTAENGGWHTDCSGQAKACCRRSGCQDRPQTSIIVQGIVGPPFQAYRARAFFEANLAEELLIGCEVA